MGGGPVITRSNQLYGRDGVIPFRFTKVLRVTSTCTLFPDRKLSDISAYAKTTSDHPWGADPQETWRFTARNGTIYPRRRSRRSGGAYNVSTSRAMRGRTLRLASTNAGVDGLLKGPSFRTIIAYKDCPVLLPFPTPADPILPD